MDRNSLIDLFWEIHCGISDLEIDGEAKRMVRDHIYSMVEKHFSGRKA